MTTQQPTTEAGQALVEWVQQSGSDIRQAVIDVEAAARAGALREAESFMVHRPSCAYVNRGRDCDCGYRAILAERQP